MSDHPAGAVPTWRERLYVIVFEANTPAGRAFDVVLITAILLSVAAVVLDSVPSIEAAYGSRLVAAEWVFTAIFTVEYLLRLAVSPQPWRYARSFYGFIDLVAILPTYLSLLFPAGRYLLVIRVVRVLRVFRVLKLTEYTGQAQVLTRALRASRHKITVFVATVLTLVTVIGSLMYLIEGPRRGFTSIPVSIYWAIVTLSTVGYGDIAPQTAPGRVLAAMVMILGYGIIAVPTGIVTVELTNAARRQREAACSECGAGDHSADAAYCRICGAPLAGGAELVRPLPAARRAGAPVGP